MSTELEIIDGPVPMLKKVTKNKDGSVEECVFHLERDKEIITTEEVVFYLSALELKFEELSLSLSISSRGSNITKKYIDMIEERIHQSKMLLDYIDRGRR